MQLVPGRIKLHSVLRILSNLSKFYAVFVNEEALGGTAQRNVFGAETLSQFIEMYVYSMMFVQETAMIGGTCGTLR